MRLFRLEIKRLLTSRRTIILLTLALGLSVVMALLPISFESVNRPNSDGTITELSGLDAIRYKRGLYAPFNGQVTPQRVQSALITYQDCVQTYGPVEEKGFPLTISVETILPIRPLLKGLTEAYADPLTGAGADWMALDPQDVVPHYYDQCAQHLRDVLYNEQRHYPTAQQKASALYAQVHKPFTLYAGFSKDAFDYIELYLLLLALLGVALAAPIFSGDYQSGADDIQRTARYGRTRLAVTKIAACLAVWLAVSALGLALHLLILDTAFGFDCLQTSFQMLYSIINLPNLNLGQLHPLPLRPSQGQPHRLAPRPGPFAITPLYLHRPGRELALQPSAGSRIGPAKQLSLPAGRLQLSAPRPDEPLNPVAYPRFRRHCDPHLSPAGRPRLLQASRLTAINKIYAK